MELIDQHTKRIMEGCKERARDAGLRFESETLEYIVTNRDLLELGPKAMIPTLYDYWVHDVEVLKERGKYELYPHNPYETVINTRPAISFYNDNNPDWLNVMIFYHVLAHIDFFQNNHFYQHTWDYDFTGQALADKRLIAKLRAEKGRWLDYVIEFGRGIDNIVGFHRELSQRHRVRTRNGRPRVDYYFDVFLQEVKKVRVTEYIKELERYNDCREKLGQGGEEAFFVEVQRQYPEFKALYEKSRRRRRHVCVDLLEHLLENSEFLNKEDNKWMKPVLQVVRKTSLFFQPQIRTKIMNEGWASYWHETLFLRDDRIRGHEVDFARVHATVTSLPRVGLNPYALGMRLYQYVEEMGEKGRHSQAFRRLLEAHKREEFDKRTGRGRDFIFDVRENLSDFLFLNIFLDQDFVSRHRLFVVGRRLNEERMVWEYFVKSRKAADYRAMLLDALYHPPHITIDPDKGEDGALYLVHHFEDKPLVKEFIANTMLGIEYLWGHKVMLETSEPEPPAGGGGSMDEESPEIQWNRVLYTMENRKLSQRTL
jgi:stage V sporulation protein R